MKRNLVTRLCQLVGAVVLTILIVNVAIYYEAGRKVDERPPLTDGLTGKWGDVSNQFADRLHHAHPIGSNAAAFSADLASQGFKSKNWGIAPGETGEAYLDESNWVCRQGAEVRWVVDDKGRLSVLKGAYREGGCL